MICFLLLFALFNNENSSKVILRHRNRHISTNNDDSIACNMCTNLMSGISGMLSDGYSEDEIQIKLLSACQLYPDGYSSICNTMGSTYLPILIHLAQEKVSESKACIKMGYCSDLESKKN